MQVGLRAGVKFEVACGGNAECCTCHVKLQKAILQSPDYVGPSEKEIDALDFAHGANELSRLAC